jgi:hypothetical protein
VWIVVSALELQARLEDFGRDVDNRSGEISEKAYPFLLVNLSTLTL